jgi:ABC-type branched-subunit amino acid transport system ATPase component
MKPKLLIVENLGKQFGGVSALNNVGCSIRSGEVVGLLGTNGSGKTTLFNVITGFLPADTGNITFRNKDLLNLPPHHIASIGIARTFQNARLINSLTVLENVLLAFKNQDGEKLHRLFLKPYSTREHKNRNTAITMLENVNLADKQNTLAQDLSYGQQKLLSIVCCLPLGADLLLLDEPFAGVSPAMTDRILSLISDLRNQGKSIFLIEHNMDIMMQICDRIIFMDAGVIICEGSPEAVRNDPRVIQAYL